MNADRATTTNSTFTENSAGSGGAAASIRNWSDRNRRRLAIKNSTFVNNRGDSSFGTTLADSGDTISLNSIVNTNSVTLDWDPPLVVPDGYVILRPSQGDSDYDEIGILFAADSDDPNP